MPTIIETRYSEQMDKATMKAWHENGEKVVGAIISCSGLGDLQWLLTVGPGLKGGSYRMVAKIKKEDNGTRRTTLNVHPPGVDRSFHVIVGYRAPTRYGYVLECLKNGIRAVNEAALAEAATPAPAHNPEEIVLESLPKADPAVQKEVDILLRLREGIDKAIKLRDDGGATADLRAQVAARLVTADQECKRANEEVSQSRHVFDAALAAAKAAFKAAEEAANREYKLTKDRAVEAHQKRAAVETELRQLDQLDAERKKALEESPELRAILALLSPKQGG
jgi:hypothetical protein